MSVYRQSSKIIIGCVLILMINMLMAVILNSKYIASAQGSTVCFKDAIKNCGTVPISVINNLNFPRRHFHFKEKLTKSGLFFEEGQVIWLFTLKNGIQKSLKHKD